MTAEYLENAFNQFADLGLPLSLPHLSGPFPSYFQGWPALSVLNGSAQCSAKEIPPSPAGSPGNCLEVSFFLEVARLATVRRGGCLWS